MPEADQDDASLYGSDSAGSNASATWLLMLAGVISLAVLVPGGGTTAGRRSRVCGCAALLGLIIGLYLALQLFPAQRLLQVGTHTMLVGTLFLLLVATMGYSSHVIQLPPCDTVISRRHAFVS